VGHYERGKEAVKPIISKNCRIRHADSFSAGPFSIVDDYCYFSTRVKIGKCSHIASGCSVAGGRERHFELGDYCSVSSGVKIWCTSDDFVNDVVTIIPEGFKNIKKHLITGDIKIGDMCAVGANSVIMPDNTIPEGTVVGALSFVPPRFKFKPWSVYAGVPIRCIGKRNKNKVLRQVRELERQIRCAMKRPR
jgi:acetyltransferase-like isoleucine patch superfamily enzyme